jgi:hypothetical protein
MDRKRRVHTIISSAAILAAVFAGTLPVQAQIGGFGTSSAGGSGGTPTGPTNSAGIYGYSASGGSGGFSTGPTNLSTSGFGLSSGAGSGGRATGPTNPSLPSFGTPGGGTRAFGGGPVSGNSFGGGPTSGNSFGIPNIMVPEGSASSQPSPPGTGR